MSKTHESYNQLNKNILVITKNIYSVIYETLEWDRDRLQPFISFQHAGYEVVASEHVVMHIIGDFPIISPWSSWNLGIGDSLLVYSSYI